MGSCEGVSSCYFFNACASLKKIELVLRFKPCPVQLSFKLAETDKEKMAAAAHSRETQKKEVVPVSTASSPDTTGVSLSSLEHVHEDGEGWTIFDEPILYVYAGKGPYVGR